MSRPERPIRLGRHLAVTCGVAFGVAAVIGCRGEPIDVTLPAADTSVPRPPPLSPFATWALERFFDWNVWIGSRSGFVALFARDGYVVDAVATGYADIETGRPMRPDTPVRIASMTKPIIAVAALQLMEEGRLALDDPLERFLPSATALRVATSESYGSDGLIPTEPLARSITVRDLLEFRSGFGGEDDDSDLARLLQERHFYFHPGTLQERIRYLLTLPLYEQPGVRWRYGWSADVLAAVVEVAAREPLDRLLERRIFAPLGMATTRYVPPPGERDALATMYTQDAEKRLVRADPVLWDPVGWTPGGNGLVSTATDYMRFALMLWNRGSYDGAKILEPETVAQMTALHVPEAILPGEDIEGLGWGLGVSVVADASATPMTDRDGDFWWAGWYGTTFLVSPSTGLAAVVISQNQPSETSGTPFAVHLAQSFAFFGL